MLPVLIVGRTSTLITVQDLGRAGRAHHGVGRSGAFDHASAALGNRLVGNTANAAVLEALLGSFTLVAVESCVVAITGAVVDLSVDGRPVAMNTAISLAPGKLLDAGLPEDGLRTYVSICGGVGGPIVLGSRSYDTLGHIGRGPLGVGDEIICAHSEVITPPWFEPVPVAPIARPVVLDAERGPRYEWMSEEAQRALVNTTWIVDPSIDRIGVRLRGPKLERRANRVGLELPSEAMIPGAVQLPSGGQPIILGPDCGTTGGYPVVAVLTRRALNVAGQVRPGDSVRLRLR